MNKPDVYVEPFQQEGSTGEFLPWTLDEIEHESRDFARRLLAAYYVF